MKTLSVYLFLFCAIFVAGRPSFFTEEPTGNFLFLLLNSLEAWAWTAGLKFVKRIPEASLLRSFRLVYHDRKMESNKLASRSVQES